MLSGQLVALNARAQVAHRILDRALRLEAEHARDLVRVDVVGADVVGGRGDDRDRRPCPETPPAPRACTMCAISHDGQVLEAGVEGLAGDLLVAAPRAAACRRRTMSCTCRLGRFCVAAEHRDLAGVDGVVGEDVDRQVEALARRVAAHRRRPDHHAGEVRRLVLEQQRLAHALVLVVERERHQRVVLGHVRRVGHAVDRARRGVDEALHAGLLGRDHHRLERSRS